MKLSKLSTRRIFVLEIVVIHAYIFIFNKTIFPFTYITENNVLKLFFTVKLLHIQLTDT